MPHRHLAAAAPRILSHVPRPAPLFAEPSFAVWCTEGSSAHPGPKLWSAWQVIGANLWPAMVSEERWWSDASPQRCIWASCAAAAFLSSLGLRAEVVSAGLQVYLAGPGGITAPGMSLGHPDPSTGHPGLHNVVLIGDGRRRWLLETSLWQAHRPRFGDLPDLMLVEMPPQPPDLGLFRQHFERFGAEFVTAVTDARPGGAVGLGWGLMRARTEWRTAPDARPERARAVARKLEAIRAGRARLVPV